MLSCRHSHFVYVQEISLPDGRVFKVFSKCMVKIFVRTGANHRTKLCMDLVDDREMADQ